MVHKKAQNRTEPPNHVRRFRNDFCSIVDMEENYYYSGWTQCNYSEPNSINNSTFSVPNQILPLHHHHQYHASDSAFESLHHRFGHFNSSSWPVSIDGVSEDRTASASKSHSQAEKRRRDRINAQLATLRKLIPKSDKMDKAALLGSVVDHVKDLKRKAMDVSKTITVPTEIDEVTIDYHHHHAAQDESYAKLNISKDKIVISVCCDDRPELFSELIQVLKGLKLTAVKADIASVGGRIKSILVLCSKDSKEGSVCLSTLKQSLKSAVNKIASSSMPSNCPTRSKRQRFFLPSYCLQ